MVGRLITRPGGRGTAVSSGAVFRSTVVTTLKLACCPLSWALAGEEIAAHTASEAALTTAHHHPFRLLSAIFLSLKAIAFAMTGRPAHDDSEGGREMATPKQG